MAHGRVSLSGLLTTVKSEGQESHTLLGAVDFQACIPRHCCASFLASI